MIIQLYGMIRALTLLPEMFRLRGQARQVTQGMTCRTSRRQSSCAKIP